MQIEIKVEDIYLSVECVVNREDPEFGGDLDIEIQKVYLADETIDVWPMLEDEEFANKVEEAIYLAVIHRDY